MRVYKVIKKEDDIIYLIMHGDRSMRSFQINETLIHLIDEEGGDEYIHPEWRGLIKGKEQEYLEFCNDHGYPDAPATSLDELIENILEGIEAGAIDYIPKHWKNG